MQSASQVVARLREGVARLRSEPAHASIRGLRSDASRTGDEKDGAESVHDPELVHRVRVACARLRVRIELSGARVLRDDLRWLRRCAAPLRDLDVLIEGAHPEAWARWLEHRRAEERKRFLEALASSRAAGLLAAIAHAPGLGSDADDESARERLERLYQRARRAGRRVRDPDAPVEAFHALRRRLRRLRYALEWMELDAEPLETVQAELGALNDQTVAIRELEGSPLAGTLGAKKSALERDLAPRRARAVRAWQSVASWIEER